MIQPPRNCDLADGAAGSSSSGGDPSFAVAAGATSIAAACVGGAAGARAGEAAGMADGSTVAAASGEGCCSTVMGSALEVEGVRSGETEAVCVPALTVSVFTNTGRIGSVEPMAGPVCVAGLLEGSAAMAVGGTAACVRSTGMVAALATSK